MAEREIVCVTGAGGYLASWVVKFLLAKGHVVHGTVRDPGDEKNAHLKNLDNAKENLKLFKADLLDYEALYAAIQGCSGVIHVACQIPSRPIAYVSSVFETVSQSDLSVTTGNPANNKRTSKEKIWESAVTGTRNVLTACLNAMVKKVVHVSSVGTIFINPNWPHDEDMNEDCWTDIKICEEMQDSYLLGKTIAEKDAWEFAIQKELNMVVICPSLIMGPLLQPTMNETGKYLLSFVKDEAEPADNGMRSVVDVRDVAEAILLVYEKLEAEGRYICSAYNITAKELVEKMKLIYPNFNYPKSFEKETPWRKVTSEKLQKLGWKFKTLEETITDSVKNYVERGDLDLM